MRRVDAPIRLDRLVLPAHRVGVIGGWLAAHVVPGDTCPHAVDDERCRRFDARRRSAAVAASFL